MEEDRFEAAARRENQSWGDWDRWIGLRYDNKKGRPYKRKHHLAFWFPPYLLWGLLRAANHDWQHPTVGRAIERFFLGSGFWFSGATVLILLWVWGAILRRSHAKG
jgi:hypothetical protein